MAVWLETKCAYLIKGETGMADTPPSKLYKYATFDRIDVLINEHIRFTQPEEFNDPFELSPAITGLTSESELEKMYEREFYVTVAAEYYKEPRYRLVGIQLFDFFRLASDKKTEVGKQFKNINPALAPKLTAATRVIRKQVCILCLCEEPYNLLMWSHYANNHTGIVFEFDALHPVFNRKLSEHDDMRHLRRVHYAHERPNLDLAEIDAKSLLLTKGHVWAYENEWRQIESITHAKIIHKKVPNDILLFDMPAAAITGIFIGARASDENIENLVRLISSDQKYAHIKLKKYSLHATRFELFVSSET